MSYSITCSTKILTLAIAPFLFVFVGVNCEFAILPGVYILLSPQEEEVLILPKIYRHRCTHLATHSSKRFKPLFTLCYYAKVVVKLEKTNKKLSCVIVLIMRPK